MRAVIQRVSEANVTINNEITGEIGLGFLVLVGIEHADTQKDIDWLVRKITGLRVFSDKNGKMNLSIRDIEGGILAISQFTLHASCKKGNRPSFMKAAKPEAAIPLYNQFIISTEEALNKKIATGVFAADMKVSLINDGPVTIILDSQNPE